MIIGVYSLIHTHNYANIYTHIQTYRYINIQHTYILGKEKELKKKKKSRERILVPNSTSRNNILTVSVIIKCILCACQPGMLS